ncbi:unnamed protein product [Effrenium voratum]|nr:unnamed protein product [Effrenium voratum]
MGDEVEEPEPEEPEEPEANSKLADAREKEELRGKEAFQRGDYEEAVKAWTASLRSVKYLLEKNLYAHNAEHQKEVEKMDVRFNLNLAMAHIRMREFGKAIEFADNALKRDPKNTVALYRKSLALMEVLNFPEAMVCLQQFLEISPDSKSAQEMLQRARYHEKKGELRAKKIAKRIFGSQASSSGTSGASFGASGLLQRLRQICCRRRKED